MQYCLQRYIKVKEKGDYHFSMSNRLLNFNCTFAPDSLLKTTRLEKTIILLDFFRPLLFFFVKDAPLNTKR